MADNEGNPPARRPGAPEPASDAKKHASKLVVLSSVAKVPPQEDADSLLGEPSPSDTKAGGLPPPLPRKPTEEGLIRPVGWTIRPGGTTTIIKLPPKTGVLPRLTSLSTAGSKPETSVLHHAPPPLPPKLEEPPEGEEETKRLPPVKLHPHTANEDSLFPPSEEVPAHLPPPLSITKPSGATPPPLPLRPLATSRDNPAPAASSINPSLRKTTTVLRSKSSSRLADPSAALQATTLLSPALVQPPTIVGTPSTPSPVPQVEAKTEAAPVNPASPLVPSGVFPSEAAPVTNPLAATTHLNAPTSNPPLSRATGPVMRLPPRINPLDRAATKAELALKTEAGAPVVAAAVSVPPAIAKPAAVANPPKVFPGTAPTLPITPAARVATARSETRPAVEAEGLATPVDAATTEGKTKSQLNRAARLRKRRVMGIVGFYILLIAIVPCLYFAALYFSQETRVEGQVIPPAGMLLSKEVWIVTDFRDLASGIASDLAGDRTMVMQEMQEKLSHVQRAQADVASREARIRLLKDQIQAANDEQLALVKQSREASQQVWDGPGAQLEDDYKNRLTGLAQAIAARAKSLNIKYDPDPNFYSPEVWANAFRLGLYEVPKGVDPVKERLWLEGQMKGWRDFTKEMDAKQNSLREQAVQLKMAPAPKIADLKTQIDDLQQRIDGTIAEEEPLKAELEQAQTDLAVVQAKESGLDAKPYDKLDALPESNITKRLPLASNGRFSWREVEKESKYAEDEKSHAYWLFSRATRSDGRQYWALHRFTVDKDSTVLLMIEPESFISTKAILRPDLSPDEQAQ
jgi:hypothetical protein